MSIDATGPLIARDLPPDDVAETAETVEVIQRLMAQLPDEQRLCVTLYYVAGYSERELSEILGLPLGTVKSRLSRARARLRKEFEQMAERALRDSRPDAEFWRSATGSMAGRITSTRTGEPVEAAELMLCVWDAGIYVEATSDADGRWEATELVPGGYAVTMTHPDYACAQNWHRRKPPGPFRQVVVRPGQAVHGVDFELQPGFRARGMVLGQDGTPLASARVFAWRWSGGLLDKWRGTRTDEVGQFTLGRLPGDHYIVGVLAGDEDECGYSLPVCYYPGTFSLAKAELIRVSDDQPLQYTPFQVPLTGDVRLTVTVSDEQTHEAIAGARVLINVSEPTSNRFTGHTDGTGTFQSECLEPGRYLVIAGAEEQGYARASRVIEISEGRDTFELGLELPKGAILEGRVVTEDGSELPELERFVCTLYPETGELGAPGFMGIGSGGGPGRWRYILSLREGPQPEEMRMDAEGHMASPPLAPGRIRPQTQYHSLEWRVVRTVFRGELLGLGDSIECKAGDGADGLELVIASNLGVITGRVLSSQDGDPVEGATVRLTRADDQPIQGLSTSADSSGSFLLNGVPAGPYALKVAGMKMCLLSESSGRRGMKKLETEKDVSVEPDGVVHVDLIA